MGRKKTALVTGANRGIGKEIVRQLVGQGFKVFAAARDLNMVKESVKGIAADASVVFLDVSDESSVRNAAEMVSKQIDQLDVLINNAGVIGNSKMLDFDIQQLDSVMATNFKGPILTTKYFMGLLRQSDDPRIINISSGMGELASLEHGGYAAYRLSKTALNAFTILLAAELSKIKIFSVCPGWVKTDMGGKGALLEVALGADTAVWLSTSGSAVSGKFYRNRKVINW